MRSDFPLTVHFDGSCPMCRSELLNIQVHDPRGCLPRYAAWQACRRADACEAGCCPIDADRSAATRRVMKVFMARWLLLLAYGHILAGMAIPLFAYSAEFDYYSGLLQRAFWPHAAVPAQTLEFQRWVVALFGPTIASVGVVMAYLVRAGVKSGERWPWDAILVALAVWAPGDIFISMLKHLWLHVQIDVAVLLAIVPPAAMLRICATGKQAQIIH